MNQVPNQSSERRPAELAALDRLRSGRRHTAKPKAGKAEWSSARDPQLVGELVESMVQAEAWQDHLSVADLVVRWADMVGQVNAAHCKPVGYNAGVLTIQAESSAWLTALRLGLGTIQSRIDQQLGQGLVTEIRLRGPAGPPHAKGHWRVKGQPGSA